MAGLDERLNMIEKKISEESFRTNSGLGNEVGYYVFDYAPRQELFVRNHIQYLKEKGLWIYGLDMEGASNIYDTQIDGPIGIVVGNEGDGISRLVKQNCDFMIKIPMTGKINSLNASVSTAISIYEVVRQKSKKG